MDLFKNEISPNAPLAAKMRPQNYMNTLDSIQKILGPGTLLRKAIEHDKIGSLILRTAGSSQTT